MKRWFWNVLLAIDQLGNALAAGDPDETISSRLGKWKLNRQREGTWPPGPLHPAWWLERILDRIDPNHVLDAIEYDEGEPIEAQEHAVVWEANVPR